MRAHRTLIQPRKNERTGAIRSKEGTKWFKHSDSGRGVKDETKWRLYETQEGKCAKCLSKVGLGELKFESKRFEDPLSNRLIHKDEKLCIPQSNL